MHLESYEEKNINKNIKMLKRTFIIFSYLALIPKGSTSLTDFDIRNSGTEVDQDKI